MKHALLFFLFLGGVAHAAQKATFLYDLLKNPGKHRPVHYDPDSRDRFLDIRMWIWHDDQKDRVYIARPQLSPEVFLMVVDARAFPLSSIDPKAKKLFERYDELIENMDVGYLLTSGPFKGFYALVSKFEKSTYINIMPVRYEVIMAKQAVAAIGMDQGDQANYYPIRGYVLDRSFFCMLRNVKCY